MSIEVGSSELPDCAGPTVLCVIPTHGRDALLRRALESIENQTRLPDRVCVVDDLSSGETQSLVRAWGSRQAFHVDYIAHAPSGAASAGGSRNRGAQGATETLIAFLDDDDWWSPAFLARGISAIEASRGALVVAWTAHVLNDVSSIGLRIRPGLRAKDILAENPGLTGSNFIISASAFAAVGGFDTTLFVSNDLDFFIRLLKSGFSYTVLAEELVGQVAHQHGQLTTPSERRAQGLERYLDRYSEEMSIRQRREIKRSIHAVRRHIASNFAGVIAHSFAQLWFSSPAKLVVSTQKVVTGRRSIYSTPIKTDDSISVTHFGVVGDSPGGMAQVVNRYLEWNFDGFEVAAVATTRRARDPLAGLLTVKALFHMLSHRYSPGAVAVVHLSERGSFVREGLVALAARWLGMGVVIHLHGAEFVEFARRHPTLCRGVLRSAHQVAVLTAESRSAVLDLLGQGAPVTVVPNGVDLPAHAPDKPRREVLFAGEVGLRKGVDVLTAAWLRVSETRTDWRLIVAGPDGGLSAMVETLPNATYVGSLPHEDLQKIIASSPIAVLPSRKEALPMFILEAMAQGCVIIATDVGQVRSVVNERNGILIASDDANDLYHAFMTMFETEDGRLRSMGENSRENIREGYSAEITKSTISTIWRRASNDSRRQ